jgi:phi13 family phage major tail protein
MENASYPTIGFDKLYVAALLSDDENRVAYGESRLLPGAVSASVDPKMEVDNFYADDGVYAQVTSGVVTEIQLTVANISNANYAWLMGATYDAETGQLIESSKDVPRTVALGYRAQLANGTHEYVWRMAGVFSKPKKSFHTKENKIKYTHNELVFNARPLRNGQLVNALSSDDVNVIGLGLDDAKLGTMEEGFFSSPLFVANQQETRISDLSVSTPVGEDVLAGDLDVSFTAAEDAKAIKVQVLDVNGVWREVQTVEAVETTSVQARIRHQPGLTGGNRYAVRLLVIGGTFAGTSNSADGVAASE